MPGMVADLVVAGEVFQAVLAVSAAGLVVVEALVEVGSNFKSEVLI